MWIRFEQADLRWELREGFAPLDSRETIDPSLGTALRAAHPFVARLTEHELASWIVGRLAFCAGSAWGSLRTEFAHDTNECGYQIRAKNAAGEMVGQGAVVLQAGRTIFFCLNIKTDDFQAQLVDLLADSPRDLERCEIIVREPETKHRRSYGWNGHALLNS